MNKTKLASFGNVKDIKKYLDLTETYDKFENKYSLSSKIFSWGWNETEICFVRETVNNDSKYFFHLKYHSTNGIPNIYEIKILLNDGVLSYVPMELSYHNDGKTYWRKVSAELSLEQISQIIESPLCEIRVDEKFGNKDYPNKVAKEFREKLKDFFEGAIYIADFPASKEVLLLQIAAEKETEAATKLQADEEKKLKAQEEKKARGTGAKILSLVKWFFLIIVLLSIINTFFGEKTTTKSTAQSPKIAEPVMVPNQQGVQKDQEQGASKEGAPQSENK